MIEDIMIGKVSETDMHDVKIENLLGRYEVKLYMNKIANLLSSKTILVSGADSSIASKISRQIMRLGPKKLVLFGYCENSIYLIDMELKKQVTVDTEIIPIIACLQDRERIFAIMEEY